MRIVPGVRRRIIFCCFLASVASAALAGVGIAAGSAASRAATLEPAVAPLALAAPPPTLRETGLYADWADKRVDSQNLPFSPQYPLWTDGASKRRWLHLPAGAFIDGSNPDAWVFPVGTRLWKEFAFGRRVETRYMERTERGWTYASYIWNQDESEATLAPFGGARASVTGHAGPTSHAIPSAGECRACHANGESPVLGFSALQLSPDRDPGAPHAAPPSADDASIATLVATGRLRGYPDDSAASSPRIHSSSPIERSALGYLHGNCSSCHQPNGALAALGMSLRHETRSVEEAGRATTVDQASAFSLPGTRSARRVVAGDPEHSVLLARMRSRDPSTQMPPIGTHVVDTEAITLIAAWIHELDWGHEPQ